MDDEHNNLPMVPTTLLDRVAEDPNAGAIVALGLAGIAAVERNLAAEREERQREREAELATKRLEAEERQREREERHRQQEAEAQERQRQREDRKEREDRARKDRKEREERTHTHEIAVWKQKQLPLLVIAAILCFSIVIAGIYLIEVNAVLAATIITAAVMALIAMAQNAVKAIGLHPTKETKALSPAESGEDEDPNE